MKTSHVELYVVRGSLGNLNYQWKELSEMKHTEGIFKISESSTVNGFNASTLRIFQVNPKERKKETMFGERNGHLPTYLINITITQ